MNGYHIVGVTPLRFISVFLLLTVVSCAFAQSPAERAEAAHQLLRAGKYDEAIATYRELVRSAPQDAGMMLNLAIAEYTAKRFQDAARDAEAAARLRPDLTPAYLFIGGSYLELGQHARAVEPLEKAVAGLPGDRNAPLMLGEALLRVERYEDAVEQFRRSAEPLADSPRVWYGLGQAYDALAERAAAEIQKSAPDSAAAHAVIGDAAVSSARYTKAFAEYRSALAKDNSLAGVHAGLARVYQATGHPDWATETERRESAARQPEGAYGTYVSYRRQAADAYRHLDQLPPSLQQHLHRAKQAEAIGDNSGAASEWREAVHLAPGNPQIQLGLASAMLRTRDYDGVLSIVDPLLKADPRSVQANFLRGAALVNLEKPEAAIPFLRAALAADNSFAPARAALGQALLRTGKTAEAIPYLQSAIASDDDGSTRFQLLRAYQMTGEKDKAAKVLADYQAFRTARAEAIASEERIRITAPVFER